MVFFCFLPSFFSLSFFILKLYFRDLLSFGNYVVISVYIIRGGRGILLFHCYNILLFSEITLFIIFVVLFVFPNLFICYLLGGVVSLSKASFPPRAEGEAPGAARKATLEH